MKLTNLLLLAFPLFSTTAYAGTVELSFAGTVDTSGATLDGVVAPVNSPFTLDVSIDDSMAATGRYEIDAISYTLTLGTYNTVTNWSTELVATQTDGTIELESDPSFSGPDEHFLLSLTGFGPSNFDDPLTWDGPAPLSGDIIVRGLGGFDSPDELSGFSPYEGTLILTVIPEPASIVLSYCFLGLVTFLRTRNMVDNTR